MLLFIGLVFAEFEYPPDAVVRKYSMTLTHAYHNPDGRFKSSYLINGRSPGPTIEGDEGDWIELKVDNLLPVSISIHFHGVLQKGTPWSDGVPGITQYPILSGDTYTYVFRLQDQYGASWYHAHYRGYASDGIYGPINIRASKQRDRPYKSITNDTDTIKLWESLESSPQFIIGDDSFKLTMDDVMARMHHFGIDPVCIQSILINGKGRIYCHEYSLFASLAKKSKKPIIPAFDSMGCIPDLRANGYHDLTVDNFDLETPGYSAPCQATNSDRFVLFTNHERWQMLNVLNAGGQYTKSFSIDSHPMYVIAIDGVFVEPLLVEQLVLPVGSRFTVLMETNKGSEGKVFGIRFTAYRTPQIIEGLGMLIYGSQEGISETEMSSFQARSEFDGQRFQDLDGLLLVNESVSIDPRMTVPYGDDDRLVRNSKADVTFNLFFHRTGVVEFSMLRNGARLPANFDLLKPLLHKHAEGKLDDKYEPYWLTGIPYNSTVDFIIDNHRYMPHPFHLHGHHLHQISFSNSESFPFESVGEAITEKYVNLNIENPPRFDVAWVPPGGHVVARITADNPGVWLMHCHNLGHLMAGMGTVLFEATDKIPKLPDRAINQLHPIGTDKDNKGISEMLHNQHDGWLLE